MPILSWMRWITSTAEQRTIQDVGSSTAEGADLDPKAWWQSEAKQ